MTPGIHLLHKPAGPTSFSLVQQCTAAAPAKPNGRPARICHGGTLDPFASGLLLILVQPATRLFDFLHAIPKVYHATIRWGIETDNGDPLGKIIATKDAGHLRPELLDQAIASFKGWHDQTPPATSAKRVDGERAYLKAHRGETVIMPPAKVYLHEARWLSHDLPHESRLELVVRGGYYIRALARDLGQMLGCGAHVKALRRTAIGPWNDPGPEQSIVDVGQDLSITIQGRDLLPWCASRIITDAEADELKQGRTIPNENILPPDWLLPANFPDSEAPIRGFHRERFSFLLAPRDGGLGLLTLLPGGL
jgi:tRNA pseudouridine55 synthase